MEAYRGNFIVRIFLILFILFFITKTSCAEEAFSKDTLRIVKVKIIADENCIKKNKKWEDRIRKRFNLVSEDFEKLFGIKFIINNVGTWDSNDKNVETWDQYTRIRFARKQWAELRKKVRREDNDMVVAFTSQNLGGFLLRHAFGYVSVGARYVLIKEYNTFLDWQLIGGLKHELAHVFGAIDIYDINSLMGYDNYTHAVIWGRPFPRFDDLNSRIIKIMKYMDFHSDNHWGFDGINVDDLIKFLIDMSADKPKFLQPELIILKLGRAYAKKGMFNESESQFKKHIEKRPYRREGYSELAYLYAENGTKLNEALNLVNRAFELEKDTPGFIFATKGWIYHKMGNYEEALKYTQLALDELPEDKLLLKHLEAIREKISVRDRPSDLYPEGGSSHGRDPEQEEESRATPTGDPEVP